MFVFQLFRKKRKAKEDDKSQKEPVLATAQCKMLKDMSSRIAKTLGKTKEGEKHIYEDKIIFIKVTGNHIDIAVKVKQDGETLNIPVFKVLTSATMPRLYQNGPWTDHIIDDLYPRAVRKAWDKATKMRDPGAIETPEVETSLIN